MCYVSGHLDYVKYSLLPLCLCQKYTLSSVMMLSMLQCSATGLPAERGQWPGHPGAAGADAGRGSGYWWQLAKRTEETAERWEERRLLLFVGCLTSQQHASVSQGRICSDSFTCCHIEIEVADQTLTQLQYTDTRPPSPSADPIMPGAWQGTHRSANF